MNLDIKYEKYYYCLWEIAYGLSYYIGFILIIGNLYYLNNEDYIIYFLAFFIFRFIEILRLIFEKDYCLIDKI